MFFEIRFFICDLKKFRGLPDLTEPCKIYYYIRQATLQYKDILNNKYYAIHSTEKIIESCL